MHAKENNKRNLDLCFRNGLLSSAMTGLTQEYFTPFLLLLGAAARHIGLLNAMPNFFAALVQIKGADTVEWMRSRKHVVALFSALQAVSLAVLCFMALAGRASPAAVIVVVIVFTSCGAMANPAWGSLLSDLVPENRRGEYFGWWNRNLGFAVTGASLAAGGALFLLKKFNVFYGFALIFSLAAVCRVVAMVFLKSIDEPAFVPDKQPRRAFRSLFHRLKEDNFSRFVLFVSVMSFSVNMASPFFAVLMLRDLKFNYLLYSFITTVATMTVYLTMSRWGRHADRIGNLKVIRFTAPLIGVIPLLWVLNRNPFFLIFAQIFSGFLWAGFNLCSTNFIYDSVPPSRRPRGIAYFNVLNGLSLALGALAGGFVLNRLPPLFGYKILTLLVISSVLRMAAGLVLPFWIKEVRPIQELKSNELFFSMLGLRPVLGVERKTIRF